MKPGVPELAARRVLRRFEVKAPPIPVEDLVEKLGGRLSVEPLEGDISGILYRKGNAKIVGVNGADAPTRQRFTIAHELGHLLLHEGREVIVDKLVKVNLRSARAPNVANKREEIEANRFAAELLMPAEMVHSAAVELVGTRELVSDRWLVRQLADRFAVSSQAMEYRLVNLELMSPLALQSGWT